MATKEEKIAMYAQAILNEVGHDEVHDELLTGVVSHLGGSIHNLDAELVASSQAHELDTVRDSFLVKKLDLGHMEKDELDAAIDEVVEEYGRSHNKKYRAVIYYLLAKKFGKEELFL